MSLLQALLACDAALLALSFVAVVGRAPRRRGGLRLWRGAAR